MNIASSMAEFVYLLEPGKGKAFYALEMIVWLGLGLSLDELQLESFEIFMAASTAANLAFWLNFSSEDV